MDSIRTLSVLLLIIIGVIHISGMYVFPLWFILLLPALGILINIGISKYERDKEKVQHE